MIDANEYGRGTPDLPDEERPVVEPGEPDPEAVADAPDDEVPDEDRVVEPTEDDALLDG